MEKCNFLSIVISFARDISLLTYLLTYLITYLLTLNVPFLRRLLRCMRIETLVSISVTAG